MLKWFMKEDKYQYLYFIDWEAESSELKWFVEGQWGWVKKKKHLF